MEIEQIATIVALIISIILHEMAHGYAANALGDPTARLQGRLSPNPLVHIDPLGSVILPALLLISNANFFFGWAKPVPYNPYNLSNQKWGEAMVAVAGPLANIALALIFTCIVRFAPVFELSQAFVEMARYIVYINILLALFNLIPLPPLDGSKILKALLPFRAAQSYQRFMHTFESLGLFATFALIFIFINLFWAPFSMIVGSIVSILIG